MTSDTNNERAYAVRLTGAARREIDQEQDRLVALSNPEVAQDWHDGVLAAVTGLATYPERCAIASENDLFQRVAAGPPLRLLLYRRKRGPTWRILFSVHEADEDDPPTVRVHHLQHGTQAPMTEWPSEDE